MADNLSLLDFDDVRPIDVRIGGRTFSLRPQSAAIIQQVLEYSSVDMNRPIASEVIGEEPNADPRRFVRDVFSTWEDTVAATALMLGVNADPDSVTFLRDWLRPGAVIKIFEAWWEVNEIDAFFERSGRALMAVDYLKRLREFRQATTEALVKTAVLEAQQGQTETP